MPTQEERLFTVERAVALIRDDIRDINHNETILLGLVTRQGEHIREVRTSLTTMSERFEQRFTSLEERFDRLEKLILDRLPPAQS